MASKFIPSNGNSKKGIDKLGAARKAARSRVKSRRSFKGRKV